MQQGLMALRILALIGGAAIIALGNAGLRPALDPVEVARDSSPQTRHEALAGRQSVIKKGPETGSYNTFSQIRASSDLRESLLFQTQQEADRKSAGCTSTGCHTNVEPMHAQETVRLGCTDCHGGNADTSAKEKAHPQPRSKDFFKTSANPVRIGAQWNQESEEFVRFNNPGDLRVLDQTCGSAGCHTREAYNVRKSMMTHGAMLWGAALYNNGAYPLKDAHFGESYARDGTPQRIQTVPPPTPEETRAKGILPYLDPLSQWGISQPGNVLRVFERGGLRVPDIGIPNPEEEPGKPDKNLSVRGFGTANRTDPVFLGLQKTRLLDPILHFPGTNDQPGDYRHSGCTACHVIYANDRSPLHSGAYAVYGNSGRTANPDPTIPKNQSGHPIRHRLTRSIPSSQCMVCHMHPGTNMVSTYFGYTWWDNETDGELMYPSREKKLSPNQVAEIQQRNPEGSAIRGLWSDPQFLADLTNLNPQLKRTQFADFHGHGWVFRAVYKQDRKGNLLDKDGKIVPHSDPDKFRKAVHLKDIHLEKGMHCVDCHFEQDAHGNGKLYNEPRGAIEIDCTDCHGTVTQRTTLKTSGFAAPPQGTNLSTLRTPWGRKRFEVIGDRIIQRSMVKEGQEWEIVQTLDSVTPGLSHYSEKSRLAKTLQKDGTTWGVPADEKLLAHPNSSMTCYACHSSWMTGCFGCHLSMTANKKRPMLHNEGQTTRNWTSYNFQVVRDDVYMLGIDGTVTGHRVAPAASRSAVLVASQTGNREWVYSQQQTVSAEGFSGQAFSTHVPHTVRAAETKTCTDCHVSKYNDNNAVMAQLLMQGTNFVNFMGRFVYVGEEKHGFEAVVVTERDEPQAVIGSELHRIAYPENYRKHRQRGEQLKEAYHHHGETAGLQLRGEYLYTANGPGGLEVFDVAQIDHKGFSERMVSAPVSPAGQRFYVKSKFATAVAAPSTLAVDPARSHRQENDEQLPAPIYGYIFFTDRYEGLILVGAATLLDGDPTNNFLERSLTYNPNGLLNGASNLAIAGNYVYITCDRGLAILNLTDPLKPRVASIIEGPFLSKAKAVAIQFRYAFIIDDQGLKVVDVTIPEKAHPVESGTVRLEDARDIYLARTYAYVAAGKNGLVILDIERPEFPRLFLTYNAGGKINDAHAVKVAMTSASLYAYIADGQNGLRVLQLTSPARTEGNYGFSPAPAPELIATYRTRGPAVALSKGLDRDRAADESGNQIAVFGRRGARPLNLKEMQRMYLRDGKLYTVTDASP
ncbi:MAG TPA: hypothetical protein VGK99_02185 [Acidobacteriota bacterium]|jgi:hypothetical protein